MAPPVGLEPTTLKLTASCSAIELQGILNITWRNLAPLVTIEFYQKEAKILVKNHYFFLISATTAL